MNTFDVKRNALLLSTTGLLVACGAASLPAGATRESGQSTLMDKSLAGQKCSPKNHERPFVIEWDATDMSSFESRAANDVIFVKYEGCDLKVLDSCVNDSIKGSLGSYKPVEWTSGSVESLDISNEGDLFAKLPLGAATLGGRVSGGEKFHMEYYVSGTRSATRDTVYAKDLEKIPGCRGATHFVYGYNLGAFALGSTSKLHATAGGSMFGFGAGGSKTSESKADKTGGLLSSCRGETAKEASTCRVPVRLTLREISNGENPEAVNATAPDTSASLNLAGQLKTQSEREKKALEHWNTGVAKMRARDGKGCLAEFDQHDKLDPRPSGLTTSPASSNSALRAQCIMLAGQCDAGKQLFRKSVMTSNGLGPEAADRSAESASSMYCEGKLAPRDELLKASQALGRGAWEKTDAATCAANYATVKRLTGVVKPTGDDDYAVKSAVMPASLVGSVPKCFEKAGDCVSAHKAYAELTAQTNPQLSANIVRTNFELSHGSCKGKLP